MANQVQAQVVEVKPVCERETLLRLERHLAYVGSRPHRVFS
jgi:hypothetical protein